MVHQSVSLFEQLLTSFSSDFFTYKLDSFVFWALNIESFVTFHFVFEFTVSCSLVKYWAKKCCNLKNVYFEGSKNQKRTFLYFITTFHNFAFPILESRNVIDGYIYMHTGMLYFSWQKALVFWTLPASYQSWNLQRVLKSCYRGPRGFLYTCNSRSFFCLFVFYLFFWRGGGFLQHPKTR